MADGADHVRRIHGYRVGAPVELEGVRERGVDAPLDITITEVDHLDGADDEHRQVLSHDFPGGQFVKASMDDDGAVTVDFSSTSRFRISGRQDRIEMSVRDPSDRGTAIVLLQGWVMAMTVMLRGGVVLHASAVEAAGRGVAFLAHSGMGKSTVTAMAVRDGGTLVSDDVLRVEVVDGAVRAHPGLTAIRLRPAAGLLADTIPGVTVSETADGRILARVERDDGGPVPLAAVLVPLPSRDTDHLEVKWLDPPIAAVELNEYPRVYDWHVTGPQRRQFEVTAEMAESVPVGLLSIPWGPPWPDDFLGDVLDLLDRHEVAR